MELYAKGQLSFLILNCLLERDFYGLDIISEISDRSNGSIQLKKPSVYSNLTRMEKQNYVSSYLRSSDLGPNRKYYSVTEKGREFYAELKEYFERNNIDVFRDFNELEGNLLLKEDAQNKKSSPALYNTRIDNFLDNKKEDNEASEETEEDEGFFDFSSINENDNEVLNTTANEDITSLKEEVYNYQTKNDIAEQDNISQQINNFNNQNNILNDVTPYSIEENKVQKENSTTRSSFLKELYISDNQDMFKDEKTINTSTEDNFERKSEENKKDDAVFLSYSDANEYNKRLYDISKEINRHKRKRSFAEDQISITVDAPLSESNERTKASIEDFKNSMIENKNKYGNERLSQDEFYSRNNFNYKSRIDSLSEKSFSKTSQKEEDKTKDDVKDDAIFITQRVSYDAVERVKKIEPPRLKIIPESSKDSRLPAPKRDTTIDPSHKEILSRLYSRTKDSQTEQLREDALYDYNDLKDFYKNQNITFNIYKKPIEKTVHNTNKIYLIVSSIVFLLTSLFSTILYLVFLNTGNLNSDTNFLFILLPALLLIDVILKFYNYIKYKGLMPSQMLPQWQIWCYTILSMGCVIGLNFIIGLSSANFELFATTLILPLAIILVLLPVRYYLKRILLIKYWR